MKRASIFVTAAAFVAVSVVAPLTSSAQTTTQVNVSVTTTTTTQSTPNGGTTKLHYDTNSNKYYNPEQGTSSNTSSNTSNNSSSNSSTNSSKSTNYNNRSTTNGANKTSNTNSGTTTTKSNGVNPGNGTYVALGDSVAAGLGLEGQTGDSRCGRTQQAYAYRVAEARNLQLNHLACSGASVGDLVTQQGVSGANIGSQIGQAFSNGTPTLITITAGANDLEYINFVRKCYVATCGTAADTAATTGLRTAMEAKYKFALSEINRLSNGNPPRVVVTGYYNPISNYCKGKQPYATNEEIKWLNSERDKLNKSIRSAISGQKHVRYASSNFDQHGLCAKEPWTQGINDNAPLHPTAEGQAAIARSVLGRV